VTGAEKYLLDVSTQSNFNTTVTGFNKKEVTETSATVNGLTANTKYYFRVYAKKGATVSAASAVKEATTTNQ
jgi:ribosomal protein L6P/L9E